MVGRAVGLVARRPLGGVKASLEIAAAEKIEVLVVIGGVGGRAGRVSCLFGDELEDDARGDLEAGVVCEQHLEHLCLLGGEQRAVGEVAEGAEDVDEGVGGDGGLAGLIFVRVWVLGEDSVQLALDVCLHCYGLRNEHEPVVALRVWPC